MISDDDRVFVAEAWLKAGLGEHASVAAFARFVLHLMRLGAPPDLLLPAISAMKDEVLHARLCFGIASRLTGESVGPGELDLTNVLASSDEPAEILEAAIIEGCINETISVRYAEVGAEQAQDPEVRRVLLRIVEDEHRHAELAWEFLAWMLRKYPSLTATAQTCFASALSAPPPTITDEPPMTECYGQLRASSRAKLRLEVLQGTIAPRSAALFASRV